MRIDVEDLRGRIDLEDFENFLLESCTQNNVTCLVRQVRKLA